MNKVKVNTKSDVWKHFIKENSTSARCVLCTKVLKHGGNTTNLHNHYNNAHKIHAGRKSPSIEPTLPKRLKTRVETTNEDSLNKETLFTSTSNHTILKQGQTMPLMEISSDSNIDDPTSYKEYSDTESSENSAPHATNLHSLQGLKVNTKRRVKYFTHMHYLLNTIYIYSSI